MACVVGWQTMQFWGRSCFILAILYPQNRTSDKRNNKCPINHRQWYPSWIFKVTISLWITREIVPSSSVTSHALFLQSKISVFSWVRVTRYLVDVFFCFCFFSFLFTNIISWLHLCSYNVCDLLIWKQVIYLTMFIIFLHIKAKCCAL